jgi:hypothetical protein
VKSNAIQWTQKTGLSPLADPRIDPSFQPSLFPLMDGQPAAGPNELPIHPRAQAKLDLLFCAYHLNRLFASLKDLRSRGGSKQDETPFMSEIDQWLQEKETREENARQMGITADPIRAAGFTQDLRFTTPESRPNLRKPRSAFVHMILPD